MTHYSQRPFSKSAVNQFTSPQIHHYFLPDGEARANLPTSLIFWHVEAVINGRHLALLAAEPPTQSASDSDLGIGWRYLYSEKVEG